jgi:hypothetical protein
MTAHGASVASAWRVWPVRWPAWLALALGLAWFCGTDYFFGGCPTQLVGALGRLRALEPRPALH